jgi:hypothetical protein
VLTESLRRFVRGAQALAPVRPAARCLSMEVRSEAQIRHAAQQLSAESRAEAVAYAWRLRELVALNTPALFLNLVATGPVRVVLRPWEGRSVRFRGPGYFVDAGSAAPEGVEAFTEAPFSHVTALYPAVPDHPVYLISVEHQRGFVYTGDIPSWVTHVTIVVNGGTVAGEERLLHERGPQVWAA